MASIEKRRGYDGAVSYRVKIRRKGYPSQSHTFDQIQEAKQCLEAAEAALRSGQYRKVIAAEKQTFRELAQRYVTDVLNYDSRDTYNQRLYLDYWVDQIGDYKLIAIRPEVLDKYRKKIIGSVNRFGKSRGVASANRYTTLVNTVFQFGVDYLEWMEINPARCLPQLREPSGRTRYLSPNELKRLLAACRESNSPDLYLLVVLALSTGARLGELLKLKWSQVELKRERILLLTTKNGDSRALHLKNHALELLHEHAGRRRKSTTLVFESRRVVGKPAEFRKAWLYAVMRARVRDFRFHDLRHTAASYLAMNGATLPELAEILGHRSFQMVKRYTHLTESHVGDLVQKMNTKIFETV